MKFELLKAKGPGRLFVLLAFAVPLLFLWNEGGGGASLRAVAA